MALRPRVDWLIDTLKMLKRVKVLVICAHAETAMDWKMRCVCAPVSLQRFSTKA